MTMLLKFIIIVLISFCFDPIFACAPDQFQCRDKTCITQNFRCDNFEDCKDGSDEIGCSKKGCKPDEFRCGNGKCITDEFRCDNFEDCKDGSDEIGCEAIPDKNCDETKCKQPTLLYEDLNCKIAKLDHKKCCAAAYDCSHIEARANLVEEKCHFRGKAYSIGESITRGEIYGSCSLNCTCRRISSGRLGFECIPMLCVEWFNRNSKPNCYFKYQPGKCCSTGQECSKSGLSCNVAGKAYFEGQRYESPTERCTTCVCKQNQLGYPPSSHCTKYQCVQEVRYHYEVENFCAPSYLTMDDCCPIGWICPQNDNILLSKIIRKPKMKCRFGNLHLNIGDKFHRSHQGSGGKVVCECRIPPYLTCIQDYLYPVGSA